MATIIRVSGADFAANPVGFMPPVSDALQSWHYLGGSLAQSARNLAPGGADALVSGAPVVNAAFLTCDLSGYLQTSVPDNGDCTLLAAVKMPADFSFGSASAWCISGYGGGLTGPALFYGASGASPGARMGAIGAYSVAGVSTFKQALSPGVADGTTWRFFTATHKGGVGLTVSNITNGTSGTTAQTEAVYPNPSRTFRIGAGYLGTAVPLDLSFAAIYSRALSGEEQTSVYDAVKAYMARRHSISI
ncbi:LamG domain-containing protein [Neoroseomonas lacus]|uniref:Uncharacterized protein n=1 Tax=Neoroseomonas lacus TaxID=287609 RepID=A0A917KLH7_9PROT|nr:hypothetical protein [Neoroseomonas lacus]GGJ14327.1 hypothetical protein GCM10011320_21960 [Neoroseomonas lacus]